MLFSLFSVLLLLLAAFTKASKQSDEIKILPGWNKTLPSKQYSGYLTTGSGDRHLHYWFVESESSPADTPLVVWFNGGPGCSSLDGFFYEHGPFIPSDDGSTLLLRETRWSSLANMLYIEAPAGVGFSYSDSKSYSFNDDTTAEDNFNAIQDFFAMYPEYLSHKFYLTGESYAGIYVPTLAYTILKHTDAGTYTGAPLIGIAVGNGCTGTEVGICGLYQKDV